MNWPPLKAWTRKCPIRGKVHFVAINYSGKLLDRSVVLMSVLDSSIVIQVSWSELIDRSKWECGWDGNNYTYSSEIVDNEIKTISCIYPSSDSGLTMPVTTDFIRPWFSNL